MQKIVSMLYLNILLLLLENIVSLPVSLSEVIYYLKYTKLA